MKISIILPVYNEEENIQPIYERVTAVLQKLTKAYEIIFVNDGSRDRTAELLITLQKKDTYVRVLTFTRNFGHQAAVTAGLDHCTGDYVAILDADLQDPPEVLPEFLKKLEDGYDVVYAIRTSRKENFFKRVAYSGFYRLLKAVSNIDIPLDSGDFCVMTRRVVLTMRKLPERNRFVRGIRSWVGFKQTGLAYERAERHAGNSKYTFRKLLQLATDGILSFSYIPLRLMTFGGLFAFFMSIIGVFVALYLRLFTHTFVPGFATTVVLLMFSGGLIMLGLGIIGEYIARIYDEVKQRPPYVLVDAKVD
ncbi:glycosyl transferase [Candidatus Roizmanbacteria bacterium RIFCSPLOWO2_01_FULL_42_14]|uniref:Glycosyl transferase n=1 Tax=Candidatus Roizmanbacteria bacterium RIFCSPLOWO2_01_FULL_42_14 TaxID=1802068 RepID=A0A1F7J8I2_9BACT|nr:MAG: glycosyl transferase [Candidatus Roizmanbacteria bacterium RIFCSPLOWO2_01_FULL_42_14]